MFLYFHLEGFRCAHRGSFLGDPAFPCKEGFVPNAAFGPFSDIAAHKHFAQMGTGVYHRSRCATILVTNPASAVRENKEHSSSSHCFINVIPARDDYFLCSFSFLSFSKWRAHKQRGPSCTCRLTRTGPPSTNIFSRLSLRSSTSIQRALKCLRSTMSIRPSHSSP